MKDLHRFPIGTQYKTRGKHPRLCTVVEQLTTTDSNGEVVKRRYVSKHSFLDQDVFDYDVVETTIAMGLVSE